VVDETRQVRIPFRFTMEQLLLADPGLTNTGQVTALVAASPSTAVLTLGQTRYLCYPSGSASTLTAIYNTQGDRLVDGQVFTGVLADGAEVLVCGALAQAAMWPGTGEQVNPYFNATLAQAKANEFRIGIQALSLRDDEAYPDDLWDNWPECGCEHGGADYRTSDASAHSIW
jgi:hypothetical protein